MLQKERKVRQGKEQGGILFFGQSPVTTPSVYSEQKLRNRKGMRNADVSRDEPSAVTRRDDFSARHRSNRLRHAGWNRATGPERSRNNGAGRLCLEGGPESGTAPVLYAAHVSSEKSYGGVSSPHGDGVAAT